MATGAIGRNWCIHWKILQSNECFIYDKYDDAEPKKSKNKKRIAYPYLYTHAGHTAVRKIPYDNQA